MPRPRSRKHDGVAWALVTYTAACCAITAFLAFCLYSLMQPTRAQNPGVATYKPPPAVASNFTSPGRPVTEAPRIAVATQAPLETVAIALPQADVPQVEVKSKASKETPSPRHRSARRQERRSPTRDYAYQPYQQRQLFMGGYRPWYPGSFFR